MPNRILKESICTSENLALLSPEEEVFFYRIMVNCDDYGRMDAHPRILLARCFPLKIFEIPEETIASWLEALSRAGLILLYEVEGKRYLKLCTWEKHQRIRNKKSKYPAPPEDNPSTLNKNLPPPGGRFDTNLLPGGNSPKQVDSDLLTIESNCQQLSSIDSNCCQLTAIDDNCLPESNPNTIQIQSESKKEYESNPIPSKEDIFSTSPLTFSQVDLGKVLEEVVDRIPHKGNGKERLFQLAVKAKLRGMKDKEYLALLERIEKAKEGELETLKEELLFLVRGSPSRDSPGDPQGLFFQGQGAQKEGSFLPRPFFVMARRCILPPWQSLQGGAFCLRGDPPSRGTSFVPWRSCLSCPFPKRDEKEDLATTPPLSFLHNITSSFPHAFSGNPTLSSFLRVSSRNPKTDILATAFAGLLRKQKDDLATTSSDCFIPFCHREGLRRNPVAVPFFMLLSQKEENTRLLRRRNYEVRNDKEGVARKVPKGAPWQSSPKGF